MKKFLFIIAAFTLVASSFAFTAPAMRISTKYSISFSTFGVSGVFKTFNGTIAFNEQDLDASKFDVVIDVNSIKTTFAMQDKHAKSDEWFDAAKYPVIRFVSKKISKNGAGYTAVGDLNLHGITKEVSLPFSYKKTTTGGVFEGSFVINRSDFKVGDPGGMVGEEIKINVSVPVVK